MKKFLISLIALFCVVNVNAQNLEDSKWYENTYIGISGGAFGWIKPHDHGFKSFGQSLRGDATVRVGKLITPILGIEIEEEIGMGYFNTFVDHSFLSGNMLFNVNNMVHPYRGKPDNVEFSPLVGIGWHHTFGNISNNIASKFGFKLDFNLGEKQAWQINLIPTINYLLTDNGFNNQPNGQPCFDARKSYVNFQIGCTYKFKNRKNTHNFVISPYTHTDMDMAKVLRDLQCEKEKNMEAQSLIKELSKSKQVDTTKNIIILSTIGFEIGSDEISPLHRGNILQIARIIKEKNLHIQIKGYADKATGTVERNLELSKQRSVSVANELIKLGVDKSNIDSIGLGCEEQLFDENDANRAVIFIIK